MTAMLDLEPPTRQVALLLDNITDDQLSAPTPCESYSVRDLLGHLLGLTAAFRDAATKTLGPSTQADPSTTALPPLAGDWRGRLAQQLGELAEAWRDPAAWEGMTQAGGITFPASEAGRVALNEVLLHGWDLARATGQAYTGDEASLRASIALLGRSMDPEDREGMFGPVVEVPEDAPLLDRAVALSGRQPSWSPPAPSKP
ncbi:TIGR03086 family metal-binding protein [Streptomyces sp. 7N604]|uniref:TIGR03086 family metal-binding protein n=1 Tax=Streptomyces sp. 7N604 TaxID=3457415 RepID=UPI003FD3F81C